MVPFAESALHLPMKSASGGKGEVAKQFGVWLETIERTEEIFIGTERGITSCETVNRTPGEERWQKEFMLKMRGVPWEFVPGRHGHHTPVEICIDVQTANEHDENQSVTEEEVMDEAEDGNEE